MTVRDLAIGDILPPEPARPVLLSEDGAPWRVAIVAGGTEMTAARVLARLGLTCFVPEERVIRRRRRNAVRVEVLKPVWPRYLFLQAGVDTAFRARRIARLSGGQAAITGFVGTASGSSLASVPAREIDVLRAMAAEGGFSARNWREGRRLIGLAVGRSSRIIGGSFDGHRGVIDRLEESECRVLLSLFGTDDVPVWVPRDDLEALEE